VEARLVGRNWYVLESSIREHRFGKEAAPPVTQETARTDSSADWESPRYKAESPSYIAPLSERMSINELKNDFNVHRVAMDVDKIDENIKVLVVIHPRDIAEKAQFAIDQFIMRGGKLIAFLDPLPMMDTREQNEMLGSMPNNGSSLDKLVKGWGLSFDTTKVVADMNFKMQLGGRNGQPQDAPAVMAVTSEGLNSEDILTSQIDNVWLPYAGAFAGTPVQGLKETVLLKSTKESQMVDGFMAHLSGENVMKEFKPSGTQYALAIRLTGKFKTAFPSGRPEDKKDDEKKDTDKKDGDKKSEEKKPDDSLKETKQDNAVILVGDADMIVDHFTLRQVQTPFGTLSQLMNGNLNFAQNAVEQFAGDSNLIGVRSRATQNRPFEKVKQMEATANERFQSEIKRLEESKNEAQRKIIPGDECGSRIFLNARHDIRRDSARHGRQRKIFQRVFKQCFLVRS
jgi:ABC-type uncharacterized transport system involved in gliding motility auxiliary subunit